ncbi:hypothetical protein MED297_16099 [Reinekea blandensis MED297]|uniref:HTH cro/C1-type domain-containing protein n=2 Tax=Reinekea TaxID=230494 RepID=A4BDT8_9GAMM|nr:hypothetical protein MED297_16099 [Reinekea blandensis MED297]
MQFHEHLKTLRLSKGLNQQETADQLGIAKNTYIGYEKGDREPTLTVLKKMAQMFGMTISELCMDTDSRNVDENLVLLFEAVKQFDEPEMQTFADLVEAMVIRHHANRAKNLTQKP